MKKALLKDTVKEIKNTYKRFISILLMAFLGVGFFAGLRASSPDMVDTIDSYYDEQNVYDIQVISTLGLKEEDIAEIAQIENVEAVYGSYETDGKIQIESKEIIAKCITISEVNQPVLLEGKMPESENECLVEKSFLTRNNKQIGDIIQLQIEDIQNDNGEDVKYLKDSQLKIVGTIQSPLYISSDRGTSKLGAGKIDYYIYIPEDNINAKDTYTNIYVKVKDVEELTTSSDKYEEYVEEVKENIEAIKEEREKARKDQLVNIAQQKLEEAENKLNTEKQDAQAKIEEAEAKLEDSKQQLQTGQNEINSNKKKADAEFAKAEKEIENAKSQIQLNEQEFSNKEQEANAQFEQLEKQKQELQTNLDTVNATIPTLQAQYNSIIEELKDSTLTEEQKAIYEQQKITIESKIQELQQTKQTLEIGINQIESGITSGKQELESGKQQLQQAKAQLEQSERELNKTKTSTYAKIKEAQAELDEAQQKIKEGEEELSKNKQEFEQKIADAEKELTKARDKINEIENPKWYVLDRNANAGYVGFIQDTKSIENIGKVFPIVFFAVAALISLTSMTRMVGEQRMQIGTLKSLGYNEAQITMKYVIYASLACIIGGILGMCVGFVLLPKIIWMMYEMMYQIQDISITFNFKFGAMGLILIFICVVGATIYTVIKELLNTPAVLMRPKAPKQGSRVFLEKIPFIWKRLNFSNKVTVRNLFRYKKRLFMTIVGIMGCTSLILVGFAIKDSIKVVLPNQYEKVFNYSMQINLKDNLEETEKQDYITSLKENDKVEKLIETYMTSATAINGENSEDVQIIVPQDIENLQGLININDLKTKEKVEFEEKKICLTDKAAQLLNVKQGDTIILRDSDDNEIQVKISNVVENYISHYIFMSKETYQSIYGTTYDTNVILTKNIELSEEEQDVFATEIMEQNEVASVTNITSAMKSMDNTMQLLNYVVIILIISAGLLAFVVLYNLANVNISERIRELATIKVLGFYDKEVYDYIARETVILTIIGIALGLVGGYFLNYFVIGTCEINALRFAKIVKPISYVYAIIITVIFTAIVNLITYFALKKINMIESLKSVE